MPNQTAFREQTQARYYAVLSELEELKTRQLEHLEAVYEGRSSDRDAIEKERQRRSIERVFETYFEWVSETLTSEDAPFIQIVAVVLG